MDAGTLGYRIDLAREPAFQVGGVHIDPVACAMTAGDRRVHLQRRVMQVLVALAKAHGGVVPREVLSELCWGEISVSNDALNRCVQRLRRLAEADIGHAFHIETIPRVGYRLTARITDSAPVQPRSGAAARLAEPAAWRGWIAPLAVVVAVLWLGAAMSSAARPAARR
jgi:DNA-binding winged helix-turn-helix (wHTH) protein